MRALPFAPRVRALSLVAALPFAQAWSDTGLISRDDDWAGVAGVVGYRGDGLTADAGTDPRAVLADGSGTPVDVNANETDPRAVGLAAGVAEFELPDPVVALQGSATASAPHLVISLDTRGRSGVTVGYRLRDVDPSSIANAVQPVALQYRLGARGDFAPVPGGYAPDTTTGPGEATLVTPVTAKLPPAADDRPLVQLRVITTNAVGQDEWVGVDDVEVEASGRVCTPPGPVPEPPGPAPGPVTDPAPPQPQPPAGPPGPGGPLPAPAAPTLTGLTLSPRTFRAARTGAAVSRTGRAGALLGFRLSRPATVEFRITSPRPPGPPSLRTPSGGARAPAARRGRVPLVPREIGRFSVRAPRGANRLRFSGRLNGRALQSGPYRLTALAIGRDGLASPPERVGFRIR
jgi:hypothetical protein